MYYVVCEKLHKKVILKVFIIVLFVCFIISTTQHIGQIL